MSSLVRLVLDCNLLSFFNLFRIYSQALLTGIAVKSDTTSNDTITSSSEVITMYRFEVNCSRKEIEQLPTSPWLRTFKKHVLLFPADRDTRAFFCRLQSNVFDAASLFQTNHVGTFECTRWSTFSHRVIKHLQFFVQCALWKEEMKKKSWRHTEKISSRGVFKCTTWLVWNKLVPSKTLLWRREKIRGCRGLLGRVVIYCMFSYIIWY